MALTTFFVVIVAGIVRATVVVPETTYSLTINNSHVEGLEDRIAELLCEKGLERVDRPPVVTHEGNRTTIDYGKMGYLWLYIDRRPGFIAKRVTITLKHHEYDPLDESSVKRPIRTDIFFRESFLTLKDPDSETFGDVIIETLQKLPTFKKASESTQKD